MEELLQYDVSSTSYLFNHEGLMTKPQKSALVPGSRDETNQQMMREVPQRTGSYSLPVALM